MNGPETGAFVHPPHANTEPNNFTAPIASASNRSAPNERPLSDQTAIDEKEGGRSTRLTSSDDATLRPIPETEHNAKSHAHEPRKRLRIMGILGQPDRTHKDDDPDLARTDSNEAKKRKRTHHTPWGQAKAVLFGSWVNVLLICVPVGFAVRYAHLNGYAVFIVNFIAIVPLAAMLSFATEELALYVGETLGGLLNASFGNATELIGPFHHEPLAQ